MELNLERFCRAQEGVYPVALEEIRRGRKDSHWIWFVFPQMKGLGRSCYSEYYGIGSVEEAMAYLAHPVLGSRLREITLALLGLPADLTAREVLGGIDAMKVRSCMTLFYMVSKEKLFIDVLNRFYEGRLDGRTVNMMNGDDA